MAVICRTECLMKSIRRGKLIQGIVLILVLFGAQNCVHSTPQCEQAKIDVSFLGFPTSAVLDSPTRGEICGENSCCKNITEHAMWKFGQIRLEAFLRESITKLSSLFDVRAKKFDGLFREMMNNSRIEFHEMFQKTYGKIYLQNSDVFSDFFKELEQYYKKGANRLTDTLENFFGILYQRMFTVINSQYVFDDKYLECVSEHMNDVKPFGDVPQKFTMQLRRSFVATRTYYKALSTVAEAVRKVMAVRVDKECERELAYMQYCGICKGWGVRKTCSDYCTDVVLTCLKQHSAMEQEWDNFIDALDKVADRLVGPYNIEIVVEPLNIKISEAIMNFQESGTEVSRKIYSLCGKPSLLTRRKRKVDFKDAIESKPSSEIKYEPVKMHGSKKRKNKKYEEEDKTPTLEKVIKEIKSKVRETRQFWDILAYQYCNNITAPPNTANTSCWNGEGRKASWKPPPSQVINEQIYTLQVFTEKLRKAYNGEEVEIIDDSEDEVDGSGSGSGDFEIDEEVDVKNNWDNDFKNVNEIPEEPQPPPSTKRPEITRTYSGGASTISLSKALVQYLLPIVLVWFGGAISDLL